MRAALAAAVLVAAAPASAYDVWEFALPGETAEERILTPAETLREARALCRCVPAICRLMRTGLQDGTFDLDDAPTNESPLFRLFAAVIDGRGIDTPTVRAAIAAEAMMMSHTPVVPCLEAGQ